MRHFRMWALAACVPAVALLVFTAGCNKATKPGDSDKKGDDSDKGGEVSGPLKPLKAEKRGTLKGRVVLAGDPPSNLDQLTADLQKQMEKVAKAHCLDIPEDQKADTLQQNWKIDNATKGVADVYVWVKPPAGHYFELNDNERNRKGDTVTMDQPNCAYRPHAVALFPMYFDGGSKEHKPTGQTFVVKNSADFPHNTKWEGGPKNKIKDANKTIAPKDETPLPVFTPEESPVTISCNIHPFMRAYARVFDHPYFAITDSKGNFELKEVPAGADLQIVAWHPEAKYITGRDGETIKLKEGKNDPKEFKVMAK